MTESSSLDRLFRYNLLQLNKGFSLNKVFEIINANCFHPLTQYIVGYTIDSISRVCFFYRCSNCCSSSIILMMIIGFLCDPHCLIHFPRFEITIKNHIGIESLGGNTLLLLWWWRRHEPHWCCIFQRFFILSCFHDCFDEYVIRLWLLLAKWRSLRDEVSRLPALFVSGERYWSGCTWFICNCLH